MRPGLSSRIDRCFLHTKTRATIVFWIKSSSTRYAYCGRTTAAERPRHTTLSINPLTARFLPRQPAFLCGCPGWAVSPEEWAVSLADRAAQIYLCDRSSALLLQVAKVSIPEAKPAVVGHLSSESHALGGRAPNDDGCSFIVSTISDGGCWHVFICAG
jgi:hypothetical protein